MTEYEKFLAGETYDYTDSQVFASAVDAVKRCAKFNATPPYEKEAYTKALHELLPNASLSAFVIPPFYCDHGHRIFLGDNVGINRNCEFLDCADIKIGNNTLIGPGCHLLTPQHPIDYMERRKPIETPRPITIGNDCWLGGNVTICPGVTIGDRVIIAAGSVVVHNVPSDVMIAGNPAIIKKHLPTSTN